MKKNKKVKFEGYDLIPETAGKITNGVYIRKDKEAIIVNFAWGGYLKFAPIDEIKKEKDNLLKRDKVEEVCYC